jgi:RNA polymerase sigma factor (sigma-70 family)
MRDARTGAGRQLERLFRVGTVGGLTDAQLLEQFVAGDDEAAEAAFAAIVGRHEAMVLRVCRTMLRDVHAAEDAFQATFLVLARKARTLGERELLSNWLYGVALRTARKARIAAARRRLRERAAANQRSVAIAERPPDEGESRDELVRILHEEIGRLPGSYRAAVVVCYLEGMTQEQAARQLRLAESTVRGRLARARKLLGRRLTVRGVTLSTGLFALATPSEATTARLPEATVESVVRAARLFGKTGQATGGAVSATAQRVARGVLSNMWLSSLKTVAATMIAVGAIATVGTVALTLRTAKAQPQVEAAEIAGPLPGPESATAAEPSPAPAAPLPQRSGTGQVKSTKRKDSRPTQPTEVDPELAKRAPGPIVRSVPASKDCMILAYLPDQNLGHVDNFGLGNNGGGVRVLIEWGAIPREEAVAPDRKFLVALYSRKTTSNPPAGSIHAFELLDHWDEMAHWSQHPRYALEPFGTYKFEPGDGWKLFDVTPLVRAQAKAQHEGHGILLRFLNEDFRGSDWSGYDLVSREGAGQWANRRPLLLVVKAAKAEESPAK